MSDVVGANKGRFDQINVLTDPEPGHAEGFREDTWFSTPALFEL